MTDPFVVIGGDAAGLSAASKFKRERPNREVVVFERGEWVSFAYCGMPYYVKGDVESLTDLLSLSPTQIDERGINLRRNHEVIGIDPDEKSVTVRTDNTEFDQPYSDLLIATGASALTASIPGTSLEGVFTMHHMDSAGALRAYLTRPAEPSSIEIDGGYADTAYIERYATLEPPESVAIVGGGYVGIEMAEAFSAYDVSIHLFQRSRGLLPAFGDAIGTRVEETLREKGIDLHLDTEIERLDGDRHVESVVCRHETVATDCALIGVGIRPNVDILSKTDIELGDSGAIATDRFGQTNRDHVYAAGDCAEMYHAVTGEQTWVPLGLTANRAGRAIGQTVASDTTPVGDVAGTAVVKAFELECGKTGIVHHEEARAAGFDPISETITASSRSEYYPGAAETTVTLTADSGTHRLLGGSIVGTDRAAIRIDTLATAIDAELTVTELERLDLAYAPPFSPVWDPILVAAKVLSGSLKPTE